MDNSLGGAGCETSPADSSGSIISKVNVAFRTDSGIVVLVDLTTERVSSVAVATDSSFETELEPFAMPQSQEQFVAVEVDIASTAVEVVALGEDGEVLERVLLEDLSTS